MRSITLLGADRVRRVNWEHMSAQTCAIVAQTLPVFLVAVIAERIAFKGSKNARAMSRRVIAISTRIAIDFAIAAGLIGLTAVAVVGVEDGGLRGDAAEFVWSGSLMVAIAIVYRWLLLSTPLTLVWQHAAEGWVAFVSSVVEGLIDGGSLGALRLIAPVVKVVAWVSEIAFGVVSGGTATAVDRLSAGIATLLRTGTKK